ncbi:protein kinase domain-containing protein [Streptomyces sp. NPDC054863]
MDQLIAQDPTHIGPYRLVARLGAGGMGRVYLARSEAGRTVAVKVVQAEYAGHPEFRRRFAREVAAARRVGGVWTAAVLDADTDAPVPWVATQYVPGPDLHTVVAEDFGPLPEPSVRVLAHGLAQALGDIHAAGLVHRDLKPSNVLVTVDGPRVIDFGIARALDSISGDSLRTRTGMLIGSPGFMSPEQVRGLELTAASDVFCLGAVLAHATTGRPPFGAADSGLHAQIFRIAQEEPDLEGVPEGLLPLVRACLDKDPARRPTPRQIAERTAADGQATWLPVEVLAQLGRHAGQLLDFAPPQAAPARTPTTLDGTPSYTAAPQAVPPHAAAPQAIHLHAAPPHAAAPQAVPPHAAAPQAVPLHAVPTRTATPPPVPAYVPQRRPGPGIPPWRVLRLVLSVLLALVALCISDPAVEAALDITWTDNVRPHGAVAAVLGAALALPVTRRAHGRPGPYLASALTAALVLNAFLLLWHLRVAPISDLHLHVPGFR